MTDDEIDALLARSKAVRRAFDEALGYQPKETSRAGARPYAEVLERLAAGEAGTSEDLTDSEILDAHNREARELVARALGVPLPVVPAWAEADPRLDNAMRLSLAALVERVDARGVSALTARDVAARLHDPCASPIYEAALERLRAIRVITRVGSQWRIAVRA